VCQLADQRLRLLEARFNLHSLVNTEYEKDAMRVRHTSVALALTRALPPAVPLTRAARCAFFFQFAQQDFYHVVKVDTHVHAASAVVAPKLLAFIKNKYATSPNVRAYQ
jgi:hypothetical protein